MIFQKKSFFLNGDWGFGIGDWGLGIGDWGLGPIPNPQSPIPNPQSPIPNLFNVYLFFIKYYFNNKFIKNNYLSIMGNINN